MVPRTFCITRCTLEIIASGHVDSLLCQPGHLHDPSYQMQTSCYQDLDLSGFLLGAHESNGMFDARDDVDILLWKGRHQRRPRFGELVLCGQCREVVWIDSL